ncbi:Alpha/Beta hydrolase protein [Lactarius vividus]|nr:Alpha/Beta hydrolase protein [Lactarius vividus]
MTTDLKEFWDIPYTKDTNPNPLHTFDLFVPHRPPQALPAPLICFVHGGAWRSEDKKDHGDLARNLAVYTSYPVAVPNYRLSKPDNKLHHPAHAQDVLQLLTFLLSWPGPTGCQSLPYNPDKLFLMGHSCSAHMLACMLLDSSEPTLVPSPELLRAIRGVIFSEGIYNIDALLQSFPTYRDWFIADAFGDLSNYNQYSVTSMPLCEGASHIHWVIVHSKGDTLVDMRQSQGMYEHLRSLHEGSALGAGRVWNNWDDLGDEHNAVLQSGKFLQIAGDFILYSV